ncbi:MAG: hypothetical protein CSA81_02695 [Acidobacteria bacterium]|nr:MAG: hypothetical protein CSA81_02695 [Acidobacteriota bacterium]
MSTGIKQPGKAATVALSLLRFLVPALKEFLLTCPKIDNEFERQQDDSGKMELSMRYLCHIRMSQARSK